MAMVAVFSNTNIIELRDSINRFIADKKLIDIKYQSYAIQTDEGGKLLDRALVIYED